MIQALGIGIKFGADRCFIELRCELPAKKHDAIVAFCGGLQLAGKLHGVGPAKTGIRREGDSNGGLRNVLAHQIDSNFHGVKLPLQHRRTAVQMGRIPEHFIDHQNFDAADKQRAVVSDIKLQLLLDNRRQFAEKLVASLCAMGHEQQIENVLVASCGDRSRHRRVAG